MKLKQITHFFCGCCICFLYLFFTQQPVSAQVVFTDDFSNEYEKWQDVRNTFDLWSIVQQQADVFINNWSTLAEIIPKDEYWNNEWKNYIYKLDYTYLVGADKALSFWYQDLANWYQFHFIGDNYILSHIENGIEVWRQIGPLRLEVEKKYTMEVYLKDGTITFLKDGEQQFQYSDPTFNNDYGRIGLKAGAGAIFPTHVQFDNVVVTLISDVVDYILPISTLKQTDPLWNDNEYDSASHWSTAGVGIGDWGCLVTSISMILKYHGIYTFPDGSEITPATLNAWLKNQPDGFIGSGLVNWSAVSRLVKQIHNTSGTANLEYSRIAGDDLETAKTQIQNNIPVILEVPGHFLVGNGVKQDLSDIFITDPLYPHELLSQHQKPLQSTRLLTPSFTDLSYIHMSHDSTIFVELTNPDSTTPPNYQTYSQFIFNQSQTTKSPELLLHELAKPETQNYLVAISSTTQKPEPFTLTIFTYDINANFTNLTYKGIAGTIDSPTLLTIHFDKNTASTLDSNSSFQHLIADISALENQKEITKKYVAQDLLGLAHVAVNSTLANKQRYRTALTTMTDWYSPFITQSGKNILTERLAEINKNL